MVLRVVVDSNRLQSDELKAFLALDDQNFAVLTEYAWIEAYKGNSLVSIQKSMNVIKDFPDQVIVLKSTRSIYGIRAAGPGTASAMVRRDVKFQETVHGLAQAREGDKAAIAQIVEHGKTADLHMARLLADVAELPQVFQDLVDTMLTRDEVSLIRKDRPFPVELVGKVSQISEYIAAQYYRQHKLPRPSSRTRYHGFAYRHSLAAVLYFLRWVREGSPMQKAVDKLRNDIVDINFATFGTFFNGVMSDDAKVRELHLELRAVLGLTAARMPDEYYEAMRAQLLSLDDEPQPQWGA